MFLFFCLGTARNGASSGVVLSADFPIPKVVHMIRLCLCGITTHGATLFCRLGCSVNVYPFKIVFSNTDFCVTIGAKLPVNGAVVVISTYMAMGTNCAFTFRGSIAKLFALIIHGAEMGAVEILASAEFGRSRIV